VYHIDFYSDVACLRPGGITIESPNGDIAIIAEPPAPMQQCP
jgi:hypothetical protein